MECLGRYTFFVMTLSAAFREALSLASRSLQSTAPGAKKARKCQNQEPANTSESRHVKNMRKQRLCQQRRSKQPLATKRPANKSWSAVSRLRRITINLAIMEREAREARERTSIASEARAARAAKTARGRAAGSPRGAKARVARAAPDSRQQARTIAYSLARALRALAGGLSWERLGRIALLGHALEILPNSLPEAYREDHQEEQGESGEGRPRIETASAYYRL